MPGPKNVRAKAYERHIDITWDPVESKNLGRYVIYRSLGDGPFRPVGIQIPGIERYSDFVGQPGRKATYKITASDGEYRESRASEAVTASTHAMSDEDLLTMVQEACFRYYWERAHPDAGMTRENFPGDDRIVATGASGFGIMALIVGVERGFITQAQGLGRLLKIVTFLERADRYHGAWPHFLNGATGRRMPVFDMHDNGADLVETSFLMEGLLTARQYFKGTSAEEKQLYRQNHGSMERGRVGLVPQSAGQQFLVLALVAGIHVAHQSSAEWMERGDDYLHTGDRVAESRRTG